MKDLSAMAGYPLTYGSRAFEDNVAEVDSFVVARMKAAGRPILGRTTAAQLHAAMPWKDRRPPSFD